MKKNSKDVPSDELRPEYDLSNLLKEGVRGKYSQRYEARDKPRIIISRHRESLPD